MTNDRRSILLVDDEKLNLDMLSRRLGRSGFDVQVAEDGQAALDLIARNNFDIVLLDHMMPGMSGPEVLDKLRQTLSPSDLPVIMVTAVAESDKIADALSAGANDYITKPIDYKVALARLQVQFARQDAERALRTSEQRYALALEASRDALWDWDLTTDSVFYSPRWLEMAGLPEGTEDCSAKLWLGQVFALDLPKLQRCLDDARGGLRDCIECDYRLLTVEGTLRWMSSRAVVTRDAQGRPVRLAGSQSDVTEERTRDPLTGLLNRTAVVSRLEQLFLAGRDNSQVSATYSLLFLDLDGFKTVNDSLGHLAGDLLLRLIADRLNKAIVVSAGDATHEVFNTRTSAARMGGDEFAVLVESRNPLQDAQKLARRVQEQMLLPAKLEAQVVHCAFSIGVAVADLHYGSADEIINEADIAMYAAKSSGRGRILTFTREMRQAASDRLELENDLCEAVSKGELRLVYQPKVRLDTGAVYGVEALIRWDHPKRGMISPATFIPIAEKTGAILGIGQWVLRTACSQVANWQAKYPVHVAMELSVNLSPREFRQDTLVSDIQTALRETKYRPELLHLEITEGVLFDDLDKARQVLGELHRLGVLLDLDDFGSGYSSLRYLRELPFDTLKIDRYFISALDSGSASSAELIHTILLMARNLEIDVIAEGIETKPHRTALQEMGCRFGQGFYFSEPVSATAMEEILERESDPTIQPTRGGVTGFSSLKLLEAS